MGRGIGAASASDGRRGVWSRNGDARPRLIADEADPRSPRFCQAISILDLFTTIRIRPSSSPPSGPMRGTWLFADLVADESGGGRAVDLPWITGADRPRAAWHSDAGLDGAQPETIDPDLIPVRLAIRSSGRLMLAERVRIGFGESQHLLFHAPGVFAGASQCGDLHRLVR